MSDADLRISRRDLLRGFAALGAMTAVSRWSPLDAAPLVDSALKPVRFAVIGDWGSGEAGEMGVAEQMLATHRSQPIDFIIGAGDNIYPNGGADNFGPNFERPFEGLIKAGIPFYTVFGNHDIKAGRDAQLRYPMFNMKGRPYYRMPVGNGTTEFFMLDSNDMSSAQLQWLDAALTDSTAVWKIAVFHHPIYSSGKRHGSDTSLRRQIEPLFVKHGVQVAFSGHDHIYQRVVPQQGVQYFVSGAGGMIREGGINRDNLVAAGFDTETHFMVLEADANEFRYNAISVAGRSIDSGRIGAKAGAVAQLFQRLRVA